MINNSNIAIFEFFCKDSPQWSINHFLQETTVNYLKIYTLRRIIELFQEGADDNNFIIGTNSIDIYTQDIPEYIKDEDFIRLTSKRESAEKFWHYFKYLKRPIVKFSRNGIREVLYDFNSIEAITLLKLEKNSPPQISFQGTINSLIDLFRGKIFAARDNELVRQSIENLRNIVELSHLIESSSTPDGVKLYARDQVEAIMNHQDRINHRLGLNQISFRSLT